MATRLHTDVYTLANIGYRESTCARGRIRILTAVIDNKDLFIVIEQ